VAQQLQGRGDTGWIHWFTPQPYHLVGGWVVIVVMTLVLTDNAPSHLVSQETQCTDVHGEVFSLSTSPSTLFSPPSHCKLLFCPAAHLLHFSVCVTALLLNMEFSLIQIFSKHVNSNKQGSLDTYLQQ
jgi:hypothetical protein